MCIRDRINPSEGIENSLVQSKINYDPRKPYFCAGCPHNSSTIIPEGSRAYAGIGCHYMVQWMDRSTVGYTHMGGEGANWIDVRLLSFHLYDHRPSP